VPIKIHNKEYTTVAERIAQLRGDHADWSLESEILSNADIVVIKATVKDESGRVIGVGHAEEVRGSTNINKTSALENCETSAWGRALAACNYGGDQVASANEVGDAVIQQAVNDSAQRFIVHNNAVRDNLESIIFVKNALRTEDWDGAAEAMVELGDEVRMAIGIAATKGGVFDLEDTRLFKTEEYAAARTRYFEDKK